MTSTLERKLRFMADTGRYRPLRGAVQEMLAGMGEQEIADWLTDEQFADVVSLTVRKLRQESRDARRYREHHAARGRGVVVRGLAFGDPKRPMRGGGPGEAA